MYGNKIIVKKAALLLEATSQEEIASAFERLILAEKNKRQNGRRKNTLKKIASLCYMPLESLAYEHSWSCIEDWKALPIYPKNVRQGVLDGCVHYLLNRLLPELDRIGEASVQAVHAIEHLYHAVEGNLQTKIAQAAHGKKAQGHTDSHTDSHTDATETTSDGCSCGAYETYHTDTHEDSRVDSVYTVTVKCE